MTTPPSNPKIYHIVHQDRLPSILADGGLWSDAKMAANARPGTVIGMNKIKSRRLSLPLVSHPGLCVGDCVPFYFCPRSIMLYLIRMRNHPELEYRGGQDPIIHLEADLRKTVDWADNQGMRWAFTLSNAGARYFEDRGDLNRLGEIDWRAVQATNWTDCKEGKQAEFLVESRFPWALVERVGVLTDEVAVKVANCLKESSRMPRVERLPGWYY